MHELFTGARLFQAGEEGDALLKVLLGDIPNPTSLAPDLPSALDTVVLKALARHPGDRWKEAAELRDALEAACPPASARDVAALVEHLGKETLGRQRGALEAALRQAPGGRGRPSAKRIAVPVVVAAAVAAAVYLGWPLARRSGAATPATAGAEASSAVAGNHSLPAPAPAPVPEIRPEIGSGSGAGESVRTVPSASGAPPRAPVRRRPAAMGLKKNPYGDP
jgi:serine/threonine-protein kinase